MRQPLQILVTAFFLLFFVAARSQNTVSIGTQQTDPTAVLWLVGNNQGLILPIATSMASMPKKAGMIVYFSGSVYSCDGNTWTAIGGASGGSQTLTLTGNTLSISGGNSVTLATSPTASQFYMFDGTNWVAKSLSQDVLNNLGTITVTGLKGKPLPVTPTAGFLQSDASGNLSWGTPSGSLPVLTANQLLSNDGTTTKGVGVAGDLSLSVASNSATFSVSKIQGSAWPANASGVLTNNGSGTLSWAPASGTGTVMNVTASAPITVTNGTTNPAISISQANGTTNGFLSFADWTTFNNKVTLAGDLGGTAAAPTVSKIQGSAWPANASGVLTNNGSGTLSWGTAGTVSNVTGTAPITVTNGSITPTVSMAQANGTTNGFLSFADWTTFNNKLNSNILTTGGDLLYHDGTTVTRFARGTNGQVLFSTATGIQWGALTGGGDMAKATYDTNLDGFVDAAASLTTTLPLAKGGTGITTTPTASQVLTTDAGGLVTWINQSALTPSFSSQAANTFLAAPNGSAGVPTFRTMVAADLPNHDASKITTGTLPIARGGTNATAVPTNGGISYGTGTAYAFTAAGTAGQFLQSNGAAAPTWVNAPSPTGTAGGDLGGTYPNPSVAKLGGQAYTFPASNATTGVLTNSGAGVLTWAPVSGFLSSNLTSGNIIVGNSSNVATAMAVNGDATLDNTAKLVIGTGAITSTKLATSSVSGGAGGVITDGSIVDADISATAGIVDSKLATISTAGKVSGSAITSGTIGGSTSVNTTGDLITTSSGSLAIGGTTTFGGIKYTWPAAIAGSTFLTTDAAGNLSWGSIPSGWTLSGNTGTSSATNFIGTTDNVALRFKTNNVNSGLIDPLNSNNFFGYQAGNTTTGAQNNAMGTNALLANTSGGGNVAIGTGALATNTTGSSNLAIGHFADVTNGALTNATAIGANAQVSSSNSLVLGGTGANAVNVGIGTATPSAALDVVTTSPNLLNFDGGSNPLIRLSENGNYKAYMQIYTGDFYIGTITPGTDIVLYNNGTKGVTVDPSGNTTMGGYTQLGTSAPQIKMFYGTGTTSGSSNGSASVSFSGIGADKVISINVMVDYSGSNNWISPGYLYNSGFSYSWYVSGSTVVVTNNDTAPSSSLNVRGKPIRVVIMYIP